MKSDDLKVAWSLSAPEVQIFVEVLQNIAFSTQYTEDLSMAASDDHLYQFSIFF